MRVSPEDLRQCLRSRSKHSPPCERVFFWLVLWPQIQEMLSTIAELPRLEVEPRPDPPPDEWLDILVPILLRNELNAFPVEMRVEVTTRVRDGLARLANELDGEIDQLRKNA